MVLRSEYSSVFFGARGSSQWETDNLPNLISWWISKGRWVRCHLENHPPGDLLSYMYTLRDYSEICPAFGTVWEGVRFKLMMLHYSQVSYHWGALSPKLSHLASPLYVLQSHTVHVLLHYNGNLLCININAPLYKISISTVYRADFQ